MSPGRSLLRFEDKLLHEQRLLDTLTRPPDRGLLGASLLAAAAVHAAFLATPFRFIGEAPREPPPTPALPIVWRSLPEPVSSARAAASTVPSTTRLRLAARPVGFSLVATPSDPVLEPEPEAIILPSPRDPEPLLGTPMAPPEIAAGPASGREEATTPILRPESRVEPDFPAAARVRRAGGSVVLEVQVLPDGTVGAIRVAECTRPGVGLEAAATRAVRQWRYLPARRDGIPVEALVAVKVDFKW